MKELPYHSHDDVIRPVIERRFGILVAVDDFPAKGSIACRLPAIDGRKPILETSLKSSS